MRILLPTLLLLCTISLRSQNQQPDYNITLLSKRSYEGSLSGIWNYVAPDGHEYAIVCMQNGTSIIDLLDPANPIEVANFPGLKNTWREARYWKNFVYVSTEANEGLLIIDMSAAPGNIQGFFWKPDLIVHGDTIQYTNAHTINIDEKGIMSLNGGNINGGTPVLFDVDQTPGQPIYLGTPSPPSWAHDAFMRKDTLFTFDIYQGEFRVFDVTDPGNGVLLASQVTSSAFTHNGWASEDGRYLFTADEVFGGYVEAYDISDLGNIKKLDGFRTAENVIPHNTYWKNGFLVTSYYTDGVKIIDAHRPQNLVEVGSYDTYTVNDIGFHGAWGVCPFFPSGIIIVSDIENGLFVFKPEYVRACYLEGTVTDLQGTTLPGVNVRIISPLFNKDQSNNLGIYRTGIAQAGTYQVEFSKKGYYPKILEATLVNGEITLLDAVLEPYVEMTFSGTATDQQNLQDIPGAIVRVSNAEGTFYAIADENGHFSLSAFPGTYQLFAGAWGYQYSAINPIVLDAANTSFSVKLKKGYQDDFVFDYGWISEGTAESGLWERGVPEATFHNINCNPGTDVEDDYGDQCYVTGLLGGEADDHDVDNGTATLRSPAFDLSNYIHPAIHYRTWFANTGSGAFNDTLEVWLENGTERVRIEKITLPKGQWRPAKTIVVADYLEPGEKMTLEFRVSDLASSEHIVEAGVDQFLVSGDMESATLNPQPLDRLVAMPNPFSQEVLLSAELTEPIRLRVSNSMGQLIEQRHWFPAAGRQQLGQDWIPGIYFVHLQNASGSIRSNLRLIKQ